MNALVENEFAGGAVVAPRSVGIAQAEHREMAEVQSMVIMAKRFPRDQIAAMDRILNAFTRPALAEVAQYQYSKGGTDVFGPSIRAAEAIAQQWGSIDFGFRETSRGVGANGVQFSEVLAYAWDIETLARRSLQFIVPHWRDTKKGGYPIKEERDIYELVANMAQRRVRACILGVIPGDVIEQAMLQAGVTLAAKADTSPEAMQKMLETFQAFGVTKEHIEKRIQRRLEAIVPAQVVMLKRVYVSLRDGMSAPGDWFEIDETVDPVTTKTVEAYPQDKFDKELPKWAALIKSKKKTAADIIAVASSKHTLTDAQKAAITEAGKGIDDQFSFSGLVSQIQSAKTSEDLDIVADLIRSIPVEADQIDLTERLKERREELGS